MANLDDLREGDGVQIRKQLMAMSNDELMEIIRGKRTLRNAPSAKTASKAPVKRTSTKKAAAPKSRPDDLAAQAKALDGKGAAALLALLTGNQDA